MFANVSSTGMLIHNLQPTTATKANSVNREVNPLWLPQNVLLLLQATLNLKLRRIILVCYCSKIIQDLLTWLTLLVCL